MAEASSPSPFSVVSLSLSSSIVAVTLEFNDEEEDAADDDATELLLELILLIVFLLLIPYLFWYCWLCRVKLTTGRWRTCLPPPDFGSWNLNPVISWNQSRQISRMSSATKSFHCLLALEKVVMRSTASEDNVATERDSWSSSSSSSSFSSSLFFF